LVAAVEVEVVLQVQEEQQEQLQLLDHQHLCLLQAAVEVEQDLLVQILLVMVYQVALAAVEQDIMYPHLQLDQELLVKEMLVELEEGQREHLILQVAVEAQVELELQL
jgi:hypothetical protein